MLSKILRYFPLKARSNSVYIIELQGAAGVFHKIARIDDSRLATIFAREVLADLVRKELLSPEWGKRITDYSVVDRIINLIFDRAAIYHA